MLPCYLVDVKEYYHIFQIPMSMPFLNECYYVIDFPRGNTNVIVHQMLRSAIQLVSKMVNEIEI